MTKIKSINELRKAIEDGYNEFVISNGLMRSSKFINFGEEKEFFVFHLIDDFREEMDEDELIDSNIGRAIKNGTFYLDEDFSEN